MLIVFARALIFGFLVKSITANVECSSDSPPLVPKYHLMEKCHRSKLGIAAKANYTSLTSCQRLGIEKKALALNFSPPEAVGMGEPMDYTCEVLKCAEADGGLSLVNDTRYDYYSIYAKPLTHVNSTCVPATGMFYLVSTKMNYSQAQAHCKNMSSSLADVTSEQRTDLLAALLAGATVEAAFVALKSNNGSVFYNVNGDTLDCTSYRAWAPGHPRRYRDKFDCVVITRQRTWRSTSCKKKFPVLCELLPGGPYKRRGHIFASRKRNDTIVEPEQPQENHESNNKS
ncbi:uncharacterized protein LOC126367487 [Pectinophora gossypiella]|uniref:uncharacterized protein LOC126367487 n=1 Tax=Pectinophora gossypiella TaxID=13191 RepID=UPI00214E7DAF|nr:uncharacterized protein LOC126367487 [Pectinophora gossypiella]